MRVCTGICRQVLAYSGIHMGVTEVSRFSNNEFLEYFLELES